MKATIIKEIKKFENEMMPFDEFMAMALYHPNGYYTKMQTKIGRAGDFFTSVSVSPVFGEVIAKWIVRKIRDDHLPAHIVELGAGNGQMARQIIQVLERELPDFRYTVVESSPYHQQLIREAAPNARIVSSLEALTAVEGVILSNEFFDALPVKLVCFTGEVWEEVCVTVQGEELAECTRPVDSELAAWIAALDIPKPAIGQRIESPLEMVRVYKTICQRLRRGHILSIDYGMFTEDLRLPERRNGSLRGFYQHQLIENVLLYPGEMDITANVLIDQLAACGASCGLTTTQISKQRQFLLDHGILELLTEHHDPNPFSQVSKRNRAIIQFISSGDMSDFFYVLEQKRGAYLN